MSEQQFFTALFHDRHLGGHYMVLAAAETADEAQEQAHGRVKELLEGDGQARIEVLGTFSGILRPQTSGVLYASESLMFHTAQARDLDAAYANEAMVDYWTQTDAHQYVASVGEDGSRETLTLTLENEEWVLSTSFEVGERFYALLSEAVADANKDIERIESASEFPA